MLGPAVLASCVAQLAMRPTFVTFGDSITQRGFAPGWTGQLADAYQRRVDVLNRGYNGYNTRWALQLLDRVFPNNTAAPPPRLVTIFFGANDAALPDRGSARQHVPVEEYASNLRAMVAHLRSIGVPAVILITPPPISEPDRLVHVEKTYGVRLAVPERTNEAAGQYAAAAEAVAQELGVPCLNLWRAFQEVPGWQQGLLNDGLHLTQEGNAEVYHLLQALIDERFPELRVSRIPQDAPDHSAIDPQDVPVAFEKHFAKQPRHETEAAQQAARSPSREEL
jgi:lysophospholipase L1-like esterase